MYGEGKTSKEMTEVIKGHRVEQIGAWCGRNIPEEDKWIYETVKTKDGKEVRQRVPKYKPAEKKKIIKEREREAKLRKELR